MIYKPDAWVIIRITSAEGRVDKVLAGWSGSYLYGSSWKLNSGITRIVDTGKGYEIYGYSGSVYSCHKGNERLNGITASMLVDFEESVKGVGTIQVVPIADILDTYP